jgi:uncharacterized surface protein with fasciclin (FAS1) repeats
MTNRFLSLLLVGAALAGTAAAQTQPAPAPAPAPVPAAVAPAPAPAAPASSYTPFAAPSPAVDVVATLTAGGKFTTLLKLIDAAGLTATLKQPANFTVFAPTDSAFAALPAGTVDDLLKPENRTKLQHILLYHVINAPVTSAEVIGHAATDIPSVAAPATLHVDGSGGSLKINDATVAQADIKASNGTVQVIDKVLMPSG